MTWSEQAETMSKLWTDVQKQMWESWLGMSQNMSNPTAMFPGMGMFEQWQKLANQGLEMWTGSADPTMQNVSRQLVATQSTLMRFLEMSTRAWSLMIPKLEAGENWQHVLSNYMEEFRKQMMPQPANITNAATNMGELWQAYMNQMQRVLQPWMSPMQQTPGHLGVAMAGTNGGSELVELTRLYWDAYNQTIGSITGMPSVGFTRELEEKFARGFAAWKEATRAMNDYQLLMADAWSGIYEQVLREMMNRAEKGKPVESVRDLIKLWTTAADKSFDQLFRGEKYAEVQGRFVTTYMEYRIHEQKIVDELMKYSHIPTRTEMDEAHRNIYELRREVKALKKTLKESNGAAPASAGAKKPVAKKTTTQSTAQPAAEKPPEK